MSSPKKLEEAIWDGLETEDHIYVDREAGVIDTSGWQVDMGAVALAAIKSLEAKGITLIDSRHLMAWQRPV